MNQRVKIFLGILMLSIFTLSHAQDFQKQGKYICKWRKGGSFLCVSESDPISEIYKIHGPRVTHPNPPARPVFSTRLFSGPGLHPPRNFAAYGIMSFGARASSFDRERHLMLCEAYIASLPHTVELEVPTHRQIVTVWPIQSDGLAMRLNQAATRSDPLKKSALGVMLNQDAARNRLLKKNSRLYNCEEAIENYGLVVALKSIADAERTGLNITGVGPHLLAWSASKDIGKSEASILYLDMSAVTNYKQALEFLEFWRKNIESDPTLWEDGWNLEKVRLSIQQFVDKFGENFIKIANAM